MNVVEAVGLVTLLAAAGMLVLSLAGSVIRPQRSQNRVRIGATVMLALTGAFLLRHWIGDRLPPELAEYRDEPGHVLASLWWIGMAYLSNAALRRYVWFGRLARDQRPLVPKLLIDLSTVLIYLVAVLVVVHVVYGKPITAIAALSGALAIVIGYSARSSLGEIFAGISLNLSHPIRTGDCVEIDKHWGYVEEMNWRQVTLRLNNGSILFLPNSVVAAAAIVNHNLPDRRIRRHFDFTVEEDAPPMEVRAVVARAMLQSRRVMSDPPPGVVLRGCCDFGVQYQARFWIRSDEDWFSSADDVGALILASLHRAGYRMAFRRADLAAPAAAAAVPPSHPAASELAGLLACVHILRPLDVEDHGALAERARKVDLHAPECLVRQGDGGRSMFVIARGRAEVTIRQPDGVELRVAELGPGEVVGHMALLTGQPRTATVRALSALTAYELDAEALAGVFERRPAAIDLIATTVAEMQLQNERTSEAYRASHAPEGERRSTLTSAIAASIRAIFHKRGASATEATH